MGLVLDFDTFVDRRNSSPRSAPRETCGGTRGTQTGERLSSWIPRPRLRLIVPPVAASRVSTARPPRGDLTYETAMAALRRVHLRVVEQHPPA